MGAHDIRWLSFPYKTLGVVWQVCYPVYISSALVLCCSISKVDTGLFDGLELFWIWAWQRQTWWSKGSGQMGIYKEQLNVNGKQLQCDYLKYVLSYRLASSYVKDKSPLKKFFKHIGEIDVNWQISWEYEIVKGSRKIHQIQSHGDPLKLMVWNLACFCEYYFDEEWKFYVNTAHTRWWWLETLMPLNAIVACMINNLDDVEAS